MREGRLRLLYVAPERFASALLPAAPGGGADRALRRRRGALRLGVGSRFPARLPPARRRGPPVPPRRRRRRAPADPGVHGHRHSGGSGRHRRAPGPGESGGFRRGFRPAEPLSRRPQGLGRDREARPAARARRGAPRPGLRRDPQERGAGRRGPAGGRHRRRGVPRRAGRTRAHPRAEPIRRRLAAGSCAPRTPSAWASTGRTSRPSCTSRSPARSRRITRRSAAADATAGGPTSRCCGTTWTSARGSS